MPGNYGDVHLPTDLNRYNRVAVSTMSADHAHDDTCLISTHRNYVENMQLYMCTTCIICFLCGQKCHVLVQACHGATCFPQRLLDVTPFTSFIGGAGLWVERVIIRLSKDIDH